MDARSEDDGLDRDLTAETGAAETETSLEAETSDAERAEAVEAAGVNAEEADAAAEESAEGNGQEASASESAAAAKGAEEPASSEKEVIGRKDWYILKVQVNREETIKENLKRRIQLTGLEKYFDDILVPTEKVTTVKNGKKRVTKRKLYPGYIMVNMEINDDTWFLVRETAGIGDFTGAAGKPTPMLPHEVQRILQTEKADTEEAPKLKIPYEVGNLVKITDGTFKEIEGKVATIDQVTGRVTVIITIFARSTPVELEYWQVEKVG